MQLVNQRRNHDGARRHTPKPLHAESPQPSQPPVLTLETLKPAQRVEKCFGLKLTETSAGSSTRGYPWTTQRLQNCRSVTGYCMVEGCLAGSQTTWALKSVWAFPKIRGTLRRVPLKGYYKGLKGSIRV